ncbi:MAG: hypothetical protein WBG66_21745, partial [Geitlerinemataceae cyanobacterium]
MKRKNPEIFPWVSRSGVILSVLLLSVGAVGAQVPPTPTTKPGISPQEQQELEQLREAQIIREQVQAEVAQTKAVFNVLLGVLGLLLASALVGLWLLRRSVVREVTILVKDHLNELTDLEEKINTADREVRKLLQGSKTLATQFERETETFLREIDRQREAVSGLVADLSHSQQNSLADFQTQAHKARQALVRSQDEFAAR